MPNLLAETHEFLKKNGCCIDDILWVGTDKMSFSFKEFSDIAYFDYTKGVNESLVVVGKDWWLERRQYDGLEWWEFKTKPIKPPESLNPHSKDLLNEDVFICNPDFFDEDS